MAVEYNGETIVVSGRVYENELESLKSHMDQQKTVLKVDLTACDDLHGAIVQLFLAYKTLYGCEFQYGTQESIFKKALEGFRSVEDDCNK